MWSNSGYVNNQYGNYFRQKRIAGQVGAEVGVQNELLDDIGDGMDQRRETRFGGICTEYDHSYRYGPDETKAHRHDVERAGRHEAGLGDV